MEGAENEPQKRRPPGAANTTTVTRGADLANFGAAIRNHHRAGYFG